MIKASFSDFEIFFFYHVRRPCGNFSEPLKKEELILKQDIEKDQSQSREKAPNIFGKTLGNLGTKAKETMNKAQEAVARTVDRNGDGKIDAEDFGLTKENLKEASDTVKGAAIAAGQNLKLGGAALGKALADTRLEFDRKNLRPVFLEDLPFPDMGASFIAPPAMLSIVARDKKRSDNEACIGSVGYQTPTKGFDLLNLYEECASRMRLIFYPTLSQGIYLADPYREGCYIALEEYFNYLRKSMVNELQLIAQDLGASHIHIAFREHKKDSVDHKGRAKVKVYQADADESLSVSSKELSHLEIAADVQFTGHDHPTAPELIYFKNEDDILKLIRMRMDSNGNNIRSKTYRFQCDRLFGSSSSGTAKINATLSAIKYAAAGEFAQKIQRESRTELEYTIEF